MSVGVSTAVPGLSDVDLEQLRAQKSKSAAEEKVRLSKATREFESFFMYQLLKTMRKTIPENSMAAEGVLGNAGGKEIFTDMFDMEVARKVTTGEGRSLSAMLYRSLERLIDARYASKADDAVAFPELNEGPGVIPLKEPKKSPVPLKRPFIERPRPRQGVPLSVESARPSEDPVMDRWGSLIERAAAENKLDSALIAAIVETESAGNPKAISHAGAKGLMQLTDSTAADLGVVDPFDPRANIRGGAQYLRRLLDRFGNLHLALAAYNAGPSSVDRHGGVPPYRETQDYIVRVTRRMAQRAALQGSATSKVDATRADKNEHRK
jgi:Rod binding domain-containing protein